MSLRVAIYARYSSFNATTSAEAQVDSRGWIWIGRRSGNDKVVGIIVWNFE